MTKSRGGVYNQENCRSRIAPAKSIDNYYYILNIHTLFSDACQLVSTDAAVRIAAFVLTSRHVQGTYRDTYYTPVGADLLGKMPRYVLE